MLAELLQLSRNLTGQGIESDLVHRDFEKPGLSSYTTLKAVLNEQGQIVRLETLLDEEISGLWTLKKGNFKFFPAIRMPNSPLVLNVSDERWDLLKNPTIEKLRDLLQQSHESYQEIDLSNLQVEQVERIFHWQNDENEELLKKLKAFASAFHLFASNPVNVSKGVLRAVGNALVFATDNEFLKALSSLLMGIRKESRNKPPSIEYKFQLCLDFQLKDDLGFTLYNHKVKKLVLECLQNEVVSKTSSNKIICSLTGKKITLLTGPYPDWSAPPIISNRQKIFSKFSDAPCNFRYNRADSDGFAIGKNTADTLVASLKTFTDKFKGLSWCALHNGKIVQRNGRKTEENDFLIAYPSFPLEDLPLVNIFAHSVTNSADSDDVLFAIKNFGDAAEPVCKAFREKTHGKNIADYLTLLLIRQISLGQIQLAYSATPSIKDFIAAVEIWNSSESNLPPQLRIPLPSKNPPTGFDWFKPKLLFPEDISRLLTHQWIRDGTESTRLQGPPVSMVLDMFLRKPGLWKEYANRLLELTLARTFILLVHAGNRLHRDNRKELKHWRDFYAKTKDRQQDKKKPDPRYHVAQTISLLGSLLYVMNSKASNYMNESTYLLGKLLAMADNLHQCYCVAVRQGDIPNSLIGNGLLGRTAESPAQALAELLERLRVYIGWAKSASIGQNASEEYKIAVNSARKVLRLAQPLAERLHEENLLEHELTPVGKAHLLLGYLSPVLGSQNDDNSGASNSQPV